MNKTLAVTCVDYLQSSVRTDRYYNYTLRSYLDNTALKEVVQYVAIIIVRNSKKDNSLF